MISLLSLLVVIVLSILITRIASIALMHTGLSKQSARFQARSAFTGAGFTTDESEKVVNHPVRRRIVLLLMLLGNAGLVTAVSSLILTFVGNGESGTLFWKIFFLIAGLLFLWVLGTSKFVDRHLSNAIDTLLKKYTKLDVRDYASLMRLAGEYQLIELGVEKGDWLEGKTLKEARLREEGAVVLGVNRKNEYFGAPRGSTQIKPGDVLIIYGKSRRLQELDSRKKGGGGDKAHENAAKEAQNEPSPNQIQ